MKALLIETSTERGVVAIVEDGHCLYVAGLPFGYQNSRFLLPKIEEGLQALHMKPSDLDLIVAGKGPGSYTGTRVGVVSAKSIAYATKLPLVGVSSLKGFIPDKECRFAAIFDAKLSGVIFQKGVCSKGIVLYSAEPEILSLKKANESLKDVEILVTPNAKRIGPALTEWEWEETAPDPIHMVELAIEQYNAGNYSNEALLDITYLQQP